jgi:hypothetical protein
MASVFLMFQSSMVTFNILKSDNWLGDISDTKNKITFDVKTLHGGCTGCSAGYGNGS